MLWRCSREPEFGAGKIFRPHRDVRFSNDKSPYKTHCSAVINVPGGAFYTQVGADGLLVAGGGYQWSADQLARYRLAVDGGRSCDLDMLWTPASHGIDPDAPLLSLLFRRALSGVHGAALMRSGPPALIGRPHKNGGRPSGEVGRGSRSRSGPMIRRPWLP
jgi:hypothetical protein